MNEDPATDDGTQSALGNWGPLHLLAEIGHGGFGTVYRAWEPLLKREVALKIIRPRETHADAITEVLHEGQLMARVRHNNVVTIYGAQQMGHEIGLWMELVRGRTMSDLVKNEGPRSANEAALTGMSLCQAVAAVHNAGVIHRDIKAQNVMRESGGRIVLMDFGAGLTLAGGVGKHDHTIGTPAYMAPEVLLGARASAVSDVYSLGVLLYFLVTGAYPVEGKTFSDFVMAHARAERRPLGDVRPDIAPEFVRVVEGATALKPANRFQSPGTLLAALTAVATPPTVPVGSDRPLDYPRDRDERRDGVTIDRRVVAAAAVAVGIGILGTITSVAFNHTLDRSGEFADESVLSWWVWGFRSLIAGTVQASIVMLGWWGTAAIWRLLTKVAPPVEKAAQSGTRYLRTLSSKTGIEGPRMFAQALLMLQVLGIAVFCWAFIDIFAAMTSFISSASPQDLEPLRPDHVFRHQMYNLSISMLALAMSVGVYFLRRQAQRRGEDAGLSFAANYAAIAVAFILLALPWRLMWQNRSEVAVYKEMRCYVVGESRLTALLYCPTADAPRTKRVLQTDPALVRTGQFESLYTRPATPIR